MLILERPWTRQPQTLPKIATAYSQSLRALYLPAAGTFAPLSEPTVIVGSGNRYTTGVGGVGFAQTGGTTLLRTKFKQPFVGVNGGTSLSLLCQIRLNSTTVVDLATYVGIGSDSGSSGNSVFAIAADGATNSIQFLGGANLANFGGWVNSGVTLADYKPHTVLVNLWLNAAATTVTGRIYVDGRYCAEGSYTTGAMSLPFEHLCLHGTRRVTDGPTDHRVSILFAAAFVHGQTGAEGFTLAQRDRLSSNLWAELFQPLRIPIPTAAAAASSLPTLSASTFVPGSVTATGARGRVTATAP